MPGGSVVKNLPPKQEMKLQSLGWEDFWRKNWQPTPVSFLGNPMDREAWWATVHGVEGSDMIKQQQLGNK